MFQAHNLAAEHGASLHCHRPSSPPQHSSALLAPSHNPQPGPPQSTKPGLTPGPCRWRRSARKPRKRPCSAASSRPMPGQPAWLCLQRSGTSHDQPPQAWSDPPAPPPAPPEPGSPTGPPPQCNPHTPRSYPRGVPQRPWRPPRTPPAELLASMPGRRGQQTGTGAMTEGRGSAGKRLLEARLSGARLALPAIVRTGRPQQRWTGVHQQVL